MDRILMSLVALGALLPSYEALACKTSGTDTNGTACHPQGSCESSPTNATATTCCKYDPLGDGSACAPSGSPSQCQGATGHCTGLACIRDPALPSKACTGTAGQCEKATGLCSGVDYSCKLSPDSGATCTPTSAITDSQCQLSSGTCQANKSCLRNNQTDGTPCEKDANLCTTDTCQAGACVFSSATTCNSPGTCEGAGTCNPGTGICSYPADTNLSCDDGQACTKNDKCQADKSCAGTPYTCALPSAPDNSCWVSNSCNGSGGCVPSYQPDKTSCNFDSNACTVGDSCNASGACQAGATKTCNSPPNTQCYELVGSCNTGDGSCSYTKKAEKTGCDDGDPCTFQDECQVNGDCKGKQGPTCVATAECSIPSTCDGNGGCIAPADRSTKGDCASKTSGSCTTCNPCLQNETCNGGSLCVGTKVIDGTSCATETCSSGMCTNGSCACTSVPPDDMSSVSVSNDLSISPSVDGSTPGGDGSVVTTLDMTGSSTADGSGTTSSDAGGKDGNDKGKGCSTVGSDGSLFGLLLFSTLLWIRSRRARFSL